jgi:hypothetical protein
MKYLLITLCLLTAGTVLAAAPLDRTIFSSLEPGKSKSYDLSLPKGKTAISVEQSDDKVKPVLTCTFSSDGEVGLEQKKVEQCLGKLELKKEAKLTVKVTNESNKTLDFQVKQFSTK